MFRIKATDQYYFYSGKQNKSTSSFVSFSSLKVIFLTSSFFNNQAEEKKITISGKGSFLSGPNPLALHYLDYICLF